MDPFRPITSSITSASFSFLTSEEIKAISVKQVQNPRLFDNANIPTSGGLYDPVFGPTTAGDICPTCGLTSFNCPGHYGHLQLPFPVYNPLFMKNCFAVLRASCTHCHRLLASDAAIVRYTAKLVLLEHGLLLPAMSVDLFVAAGEEIKEKKKKTSKDSDDDTQQPEVALPSIDIFRKSITKWVDVSIRQALAQSRQAGTSAPKTNLDRDGYKEAGSVVHDERRKLLTSFFKEAARNKCPHCKSHVHRLKKEGSTKIVEFSLNRKQRDYQKAQGLKRKNAVFLKALADKTVTKRGSTETDEGFVERSSGSDEEELSDGIRKRRRSVSDNGSEEEEEDEEDEGFEGESEEEEENEEGEDLHKANGESAGKEIGSRKREKQTTRTLLPTEVQAHLRLLFQNEAEIFAMIYSPHGPVYASSSSSSTNSNTFITPFDLTVVGKRLKASPEMFFMDVISTPPSRFRPASTLGGELFENPQNGLLSKILTQSILIRDLNLALSGGVTTPKEKEKQSFNRKEKEKAKETAPIDKSKLEGQLLDAIIGLQIAVNSMVDSTKNPMPLKQGKMPPMGVKQILEKKEGLFRKNMMGKRVNYAARSVISPDVNIETNEIGVPPIFAKKLTFPEPVTDHNLKEMQALVRNGDTYPGASFIQREDGILISLSTLSAEEREAHANALQVPDSIERSSGRVASGVPRTKISPIPKKVYRHLRDGDVLILNRQPTLHKPSMMCHVAKVLSGEKTIRMHYANCNSYNADFDGDEMNMHFPQNVIAQAEARLIANTDNQYLVPTSGGPIRGLIQDHVVAAVWMTNKETFFSRSEYYQLIYGALRPEDGITGGGKIITLPPTIWKPRPLWTGKQIISTILRNITPQNFSGLNMSSKTKVESKYWGPESTEDEFVISDGEHICGILDKAQFGGNGLVHAVYEVFGATVAGRLLSILSRLFTKYLQHRGFSCGVEDLVLQPEAEKKRKQTLNEAHRRSLDALYKFVGLDKADEQTPDFQKNLRARMEEVLRDDRKSAGLDTTISSAMAGLWAEANKHCTGIGLWKLFPFNQMQLMTISGAKGSLVNASQISSSLGQQALEGRRVPTMVSGKTLPSFKAFETRPRAGGFVAGRFLTGIAPQEYYFHCMAGREGLIDTAVKTSRSGYLQRCLIKHLEGIRVHYDHTVRNSDRTILQFNYGEDSLDVTKQKLLYDFNFVARNYESLAQFYRPRDIQGRVIDEVAGEYAKSIFKSKDQQNLETTLSKFNPTAYLGSTSEKYYAKAQEYIKKNPSKLLKPKKKDRGDISEKMLAKMIRPSAFQSMLDVRYMRSLVEAGESVGLLASQSVGEPSTQMTLNTFHLSGFGAANVTLGIPRLREIIMTASSKPKTPTMRLFLPPEVREDVERLKRFCTTTSALHLSQVVESLTVEEQLSDKSQSDDGRSRIYDLQFNFYPESEYAAQFHIDSEMVLTSLQSSFVPMFEAEINKELRSRNRESKNSATTLGKGRALKAQAGERPDEEEDAPVKQKSDDKDPEDGDADDAKRAQQSKRKVNYDTDDEEKSEDEMSVVSTHSADGESEIDVVGSNGKKKKRAVGKKGRMQALEEEIVAESRYKYVSKVQFDKEGGRWCKMRFEFGANQPKLLLVGIAENACSKAVVRAIPGIANCYLIEAENKNEERHLFTEGANIQACWEFAYGTADLTKLMSNDISAMLYNYGVEAARANIIEEMRGIFKAYKIDVDFRHLSLIADYMTSDGGFKPFNRRGISTSSSPFAKASFETTADFLSDAVLHGDFDDLVNPSANIAIGKTMQAGTGTFDLLASFYSCCSHPQTK